MLIQTFRVGIRSNPNLPRQSRRLYICNAATDDNKQNLFDFFNKRVVEMNIGTGGSGNSVLAVWRNYQKSHTFVEVCVCGRRAPLPFLC